jgi:hypothetical protein
MTNSRGELPLQVVVGRAEASPHPIAQLLIHAYPKALATPRLSDGRLPLHMALICGADFSLLELMMRFHRQGAKHRDKASRLPLYYANLYERPEAVIRMLKGDMQAEWKKFEVGFSPDQGVEHHSFDT